MRYDVVVVGAGTAGCVLAARLSEDGDRRVCLLEAGPDYGPLADGRWPQEILSARTTARTHDWGAGGEDGRSLGGRIVGGSSAVNACMVVRGTPADYDEWGAGWSYAELQPFLERARRTLRTSPQNTDSPGPFHTAFIEAARAEGLPGLTDADAPDAPVGVAPFPANVVDGRRWNAAFAYLEPCRSRPNLTIVADTLVDHIRLRGSRTVDVLDVEGRLHEAETVVLAAGAYFSPAILLRSGIGPAEELRALGIEPVADVPVGRCLRDHCGTTVAWKPAPALEQDAAERARAGTLVEPHVVVKAASSLCATGSWDLHVLSWISAVGDGDEFEAAAIVFHMKPLSLGRVTLRSRDPRDLPIVERGFLSHPDDLLVVLEGIGLARRIGARSPLAGLLGEELRPGPLAPDEYVRRTIRNYFHPAGTCPIGAVVDSSGSVLGIDSLVVADASIMPTIPRANTNLTTAAIAERIADDLRGSLRG